MKRFILIGFLLLILAGCNNELSGFEYDSYQEVESLDLEYYAVYYYDSTDTSNENYYFDNQDAFVNNQLFTTFILDASTASDESSIGGYNGVPVLYLIRNGEVIESFIGSEIDEFKSKYFELDYSDFSQHIETSYNDVLNHSEEKYYEYFYSVYCSHCQHIKPEILDFFLHLNNVDYVMYDVSKIEGYVPIDGFVGTPTLYVVENNEVIESYVGYVEILNFIENYEK